MANTPPLPTTEPSFLTVAQAAARIGKSEEFVRLLCKEGQLPGAVQDYERGPWRIPVEAVKAWTGGYSSSNIFWWRIKSTPSWQKIIAIVTMVWAIVVGLQAIAGLIADSFSAYSDIRETFATATPLAFATAAPDETLILIATFHNTAATNAEAHTKIQRAVEVEATRLNEQGLRIAVEPTELAADQQTEAEALGKRYNASMVIWGEDTGVEVIVNFLNLKQPRFDAAAVTITERQRTQLSNPGAYSQFMVDDMPRQLTFLALFAVGQSYYISEDYPHAITSIDAAIASLEDRLRPVGLAEAYFRLGWLYQVPLLNQLSQVDDSYDLSYFSRVLERVDQNRLDKAIANYGKAIELQPDYIKAHLNRGLVLANQNRLEEALAEYNKAIELQPDLVLAYLNRGATLIEQNRLDEAIADYDKAIKLQPDFAAAYVNRGLVRAAQNKLERAIADYDKAIELQPDFGAYLNRGNAYAAQNQIEEAIANYDKAIEMQPNFAGTHLNRGLANFARNEIAEAIADYDKAIELQPNFPETYLSRGLAHFAQNQIEEAIADYDKAIELQPNFAKVYLNRGLARTLQNRLVEAMADYDRAIDLQPDFAEAYLNRGGLYYAQNRLMEALADYDQAIAINSDYAKAYNNRGLAYATQGNLVAAIADFQHYLKLRPAAEDRAQIEQWITELEAQLAKQN